MTAIINGSSPTVTFSDGTTQATSAIVSGYVPYANLPTGSVLQVVQGTYALGYTSTSSAAYVATNLTASITPKFSTSKILIIFNGNMYFSAGTGAAYTTIYRNSTNIASGGTASIGAELFGATSTSSYGAGIGKLYLSASGANWQVGPTSAFANFYIKAGTGYGVVMTTTATSWSSDSDERVKTEITPFENSLEKICSLRAGTGKYLADELNISRSFLIAQDVQKVLPEAVDVGEGENGTLQLRYTDVIPLLVASVKELNAKVDAQALEIQALKG